MYEFATGSWLFRPEAMDDIPRDVVHLAQMTQRTGQDHDDDALRQYEIQRNQHDLKGKEMHPDDFWHTLTFGSFSRHVEAGGYGERCVDTHRIRVKRIDGLRHGCQHCHLREDHAVLPGPRSHKETPRSGGPA